MYVGLCPSTTAHAPPRTSASEVRDEAARIAGVEVAIHQGLDGSQKPIQLQLRGHDRAALQANGRRDPGRGAQVPGAVDVGLSTRGQSPRAGRGASTATLAGALGLSVAQIAQALRPAFAGIDAGDWVDPDGETRDVYVRFAPEYRADQAALEYLPIARPARRGRARP